MGHAGAIVSRGMGTAASRPQGRERTKRFASSVSKMAAFQDAGAMVANFPTDIADAVTKQLRK